MEAPVALITGAARRIGRSIVEILHAAGMRVTIHHHRSEEAACALAATLNRARQQSALTVAADLSDADACKTLVDTALSHYGRLDALINNAALFFPTPVGQIEASSLDKLVAVNLRAPLLLAQAGAPQLRAARGCIVNVLDVYAERSLADHAAYVATKAGLSAATRSLARDLAPQVRVNGVAPGAILWPEDNDSEDRQAILNAIPMQRLGEPADIAKAVRFLIFDAPYVTGQILTVDGGRLMTI